jgi:hypothetical protein
MNDNIIIECDVALGDIDIGHIENNAFVSHKSPPKGYPKDKSKYADEKRFKYPIDTESRVRAAWSYINMPKNQKGYSSEELAHIKSKIKAAGKKFGIEFNDKEDKKN